MVNIDERGPEKSPHMKIKQEDPNLFGPFPLRAIFLLLPPLSRYTMSTTSGIIGAMSPGLRFRLAVRTANYILSAFIISLREPVLSPLF